MSFLGSFDIDDTCVFAVNTHDPSDGSASDADSVPSYRVYEDETTTAILTGSMAKLDDTNTLGFYSESITLSAANGFEKDKSYTIYITAAVSSTTGTTHHTLKIGQKVDATYISGDSDAADNLELMFDGTGYTDETAPASRAQVDGIGSGSGGSIPFEAVEDNTGGAIIDSVTFVGSVASGTFANTASDDGTSHEINETGNDIDIVYGFQVGGGRVGTTVQITANVNGNADEIKVKAYDHVGSDWEIIGTVTGDGGSTPKVIEPALFQKYTGTGSELGKVYIRFDTDSTTPSLLEVDQCIVLAANLGQTTGYADGAVWLDTNASNTNTESFVDGVADNPVSTLAAALTISGNVGIKRIRVISGSSITFASSQSNCEYFGENWDLALGNQSLTDCHIIGASLSGIATGTGVIFERCIFDSATTLPACVMRGCFYGDATMTLGIGDYYVNNGIDRATGLATPVLDFSTAANTNLNVHNFAGAIEVSNVGGTGTDSIVMSGNGRFIGNANCTGGTVTLLGTITEIDNSGNLTITKALSLANINAEVVDVLTVDTIADSYAADGSQPTFAQAVLAIQQFLHEKSVSGTTVTVNKPDGSTAAMTFTLDDASTPTSITRAS